ncbi:unnamed protein product [Brassicogethes aeneus]|uniref:FYVE-type domain-containing protein n=1 Tax=Brassicogethes aeneus TaxID=1431903 RepID=A0A9P0AY26_BRAAE|nr:unnamed protein product [Brassicogethes aeneus]
MELLKCAEAIFHENDTSAKQISLCYKHFGSYQVKSKNEERFLFDRVFPILNKLIERNVLKKDVLFLVALACVNFRLVEEMIKYEKAIFKLDVNKASSLYDYAIFYKNHWIMEVLKDVTEDKFNPVVYNKFLLLKIIEKTHESNRNIEDIKTLINSVKIQDFDEFWTYYLKEIKRSVNIVDYCSKLSTSDKTEIFSYSVDNSILNILDKFVCFKKADFNDLLDIVKKDEDFYNNGPQQSVVFLGFIIISSVLQILISFIDDNSTVINIVKDVTEKLISITNRKYQIELLENIFALIFLKNVHLSNLETEEKYICNEKELRLILYLLKNVVDEIKLKNLYEKDTEEYNRFKDLSKNVSDATWRLDLIVNVKCFEKCEKNLLKYMLASPESLIQMCLKQGDFERSYQVIKIFNMSESKIAEEIKFAEKLNQLKESLRKTHKIKSLKKENPAVLSGNFESSVEKVIDEFFVNETDVFFCVLDLALTQPKDCDIMLDIADKHNTSGDNFYDKIRGLYDFVGINENITLSDILKSSRYDLNLNRYTTKQKFYDDLAESYKELYQSLTVDEAGVFNRSHKSHKALIKLNNICNNFVESQSKTKDNIKYLLKLYNYLKAFSGILYIEQNTTNLISNGKNTSFFQLLNYNRAELTGKLLFVRNLDPSEFEKYFGKLKLDFLYHVIGNCFPTINLHTHDVSKEELYPENSLFVPSKSIITYIQRRNWLLAFILNEMYKLDDLKMDISELRVQTFLNCLNLQSMQNLKVIFNNNIITTVLQNDISTQKLSDYVNNKVLLQDNFLTASHHSHVSCDSLETGEEILEDALKSTNWKDLFDILDSVPEHQLKKKQELIDLKDMVLANLIQDGFEIGYYKYVEFISNADARINTVLSNFRKWPGEFCVYILKSEISRFDGARHRQMPELIDWLQEIELCEKLKPILNLPNWSLVYDCCTNEKYTVISSLVLEDEIKLLLNYIEMHNPPSETLVEIRESYFMMMFELNKDFSYIKQLLDALPYQHSLNICRNLLKLLRKLPQLQFVTEYLLSNENEESLRYVEISLKLLEVFTTTEQEQLLCLLYEPLNIVEILIMNTKLDKLSVVLEILEREIPHNVLDEDKLSREKVDQLLRKYAEKSLDFRVITQPNPRLLRTPEIKLMQSLDSLNFGSDGRSFQMPEKVPDKQDWVQNHEVLECMCCQQITFSMFNRRHHCRRCGRVVCYNCSMKRMLVDTYGDIMVRVCADCFQQTVGDSNSEITDTTSTKSIYYDYWLLTDDPEHNLIVREEFSYEHAPSVSLCLSILKYHSKCIEYPKFLLEQCNLMLKLLLPSQDPIQEIDYLLVIKMLKSLAMAAKMSSVECTLQYGTSLADRILSQSELLSLLAERGCLNMLPISASQNQGPFIDAAVLRRLRDKLLEREQWNLALEVSTKTGLDNAGIFAAWGKSCLKAGCLSLAREKFQRCLEKSSYYDTLSDSATICSEHEESSSDTHLSRSRYLSRYSTNSNYSDGKPAKNPPLLNEIIQILESKTEKINVEVLDLCQSKNLSASMSSLNQGSVILSQSNDAAICILNKIKNFKEIVGGNYFPNSDKNRPQTNRPKIDPIFYDECIYYLSKYGTHISLLEFYVRNGDISTALEYINEARLSADIFNEIYVKCLKDGIVNILQEEMTKIDSTLDIWKDYLRQICRHLEKQNMLNSLYQLQQYMGDYIRAAMTCIRFYQENVDSFTDYSTKEHFLHKAEEHLKHVLEQDQWVEVASVRTSTSKDSFEEKGLINPSLVMKINSKDIDNHINTIWRQIEIVKFLSDCENNEFKPVKLLASIFYQEDDLKKKVKLPTLFGTTSEKVCLAVLAIVSGKNVEDGFDIALRIIEELKLKPAKVYCEAGKQLAKSERYAGIAQLVSSIKKSGTNDNVITDMCDEMLTLAVATFTKANVTGTKVEDLIKLISDIATKISMYIEAKQLKTACYLAIKYKRMSDVRRILREAELFNQPSIKALCLRVLQKHSHAKE